MYILIAEDEEKNALELYDYVSRFADANNLECHIELYSNGASVVENYKPVWDLILLDVDMPGMNGFSVAKSIRQVDGTVAIMFVTNLAQYAIKGYEVQALDYILKPVNYYALEMKLQRIIGMLSNGTEKTVLINNGGELVRVAINSISYVEVVNHSIIYHTNDGLIKYTGNTSLKKIQEEFDEAGFVRCHNSFLINLRYVKGINEKGVMIKDELIPVSRNKKKELMEALMEFVKRGK